MMLTPIASNAMVPAGYARIIVMLIGIMVRVVVVRRECLVGSATLYLGITTNRRIDMDAGDWTLLIVGGGLIFSVCGILVCQLILYVMKD